MDITMLVLYKSSSSSSSSTIIQSRLLMKVSEKFEHSTYLSLAGAATSIIFVATNTCLSRKNTSLVATKVCLQRQKNRSKVLSRQNCLPRQNIFVATKRLSWQIFVFVATQLCGSSRQWYSAGQENSEVKDNLMAISSLLSLTLSWYCSLVQRTMLRVRVQHEQSLTQEPEANNECICCHIVWSS